MKKKLIVGLVGSGKTTFYRYLNEQKISYAVEIELPQSCKEDEKLKESLLKLYINNINIETIIVHPYYLPSNWQEIVGDIEIELLEVSVEERLKRIIKRSGKNLNKIFPLQFILEEEQMWEEFKRLVNYEN